MTYSLSKSMESTFDFGYDVTVYPDDNIVKAFVYDKDDYDEFVMSYLLCINKDDLVSYVVLITGIVCHRTTSFGTEIIESFHEGNMGKHILREMKDVFKPIYGDAPILLYSDIEYDSTIYSNKYVYDHDKTINTLHMFHTKLFRNGYDKTNNETIV